jgi:hypothetical protein
MSSNISDYLVNIPNKDGTSNLYQAIITILGDDPFNTSEPITFIYPSQATIDMIFAEADRAGAESSDTAKLIMSHILHGSFRDPHQMADRSNPPTTFNNTSLNITGVKVESKLKVLIDTGNGHISITPAEDFRNNDSQSVYILCNGATLVAGSAQKRRKVHGRAEATASTSTLRRDITQKLLDRYCVYMCRQGKRSGINPFVHFMDCLLLHLRALGKADSGQGEYYQTALSVLSPSPMASFFLLVEPFRKGTYLIPDSVLSGVNTFDILVPPYQLYMKFVAEAMALAPNVSGPLNEWKQARYPSGQKYIRNDIVNALREDAMTAADSSSQLGQLIRQGLSTTVANKYSEPFYKLYQDFLRQMIYYRFERDPASFEKMRMNNALESWLSSKFKYLRATIPGNDYAAETPERGSNIDTSKLGNKLADEYVHTANNEYHPSAIQGDTINDAITAGYMLQEMEAGLDSSSIEYLVNSLQYTNQAFDMMGLQNVKSQLLSVLQ